MQRVDKISPPSSPPQKNSDFTADEDVSQSCEELECKC